jgi:hypothetical protein
VHYCRCLRAVGALGCDSGRDAACRRPPKELAYHTAAWHFARGMILARVAQAADRPGSHHTASSGESDGALEILTSQAAGSDLRDDEADEQSDDVPSSKALWRDAGEALVELKKALRAPALTDAYRQQYANPVEALGRIWTLLLTATLDLRTVRVCVVFLALLAASVAAAAAAEAELEVACLEQWTESEDAAAELAAGVHCRVRLGSTPGPPSRRCAYAWHSLPAFAHSSHR